MKKLSVAILMILAIFFVHESAYSQKGFSIRGGLLHDSPSSEIFPEMESGIGYVGSFGFDFYERAGLELGILHSTHDYIFNIEAGAVREREAERNTVFLKARAIPYRLGKADLVLGFGPALFSITGMRLFDAKPGIYEFEEGYSGWGVVTSVDLRYFVSEGLSLTFYLSGNFVKYGKYTINTADAIYPGDLPRGDSVCWGLTVFHRIGIPDL